MNLNHWMNLRNKISNKERETSLTFVGMPQSGGKRMKFSSKMEIFKD